MRCNAESIVMPQPSRPEHPGLEGEDLCIRMLCLCHGRWRPEQREGMLYRTLEIKI